MTTLRVMTWNVQNLFEPGDADGPPTQAAFDAKIASLAEVIDAAQPTVACLQEVGPESALSRLREALGHSMPHWWVGVPDARGIRVALLSQRVLHDRVDVTTFPDELLPVQVGDDPTGPAGPATMNQLGRSALQATVRAGNRDVQLVVCHLKSKLLTFPGGRFVPRNEDERARVAAYALYRRTGEATTLRTHLNQVLRGAGEDRAVLLVGDFNDDPDAATTQILNGPRAPRSAPSATRAPTKATETACGIWLR